MKQIVDKLNKIARAVDSNVTLPSRKLIIDSLDAITTAFKGTIVNSNLIVDKLDAIAWAVGQYDGGGGSDVPCFDYKEVNVYIDDRISTSIIDGSGAFSIDLLPLGCVYPTEGRHIVTPPEITYEYTGEEIIDNPTTKLWCVNYYDPRPLRQPYYQFKLTSIDNTSGWIAIDVNGLNCDVNVVNGFIEVTIPESQEEEIGIVIVIRSGLR